MMSMSLSDIAILNIKGSDYRCIISLISKIEAITLMQNTDSGGKKKENYNSKNIQNLKVYIKTEK